MGGSYAAAVGGEGAHATPLRIPCRDASAAQLVNLSRATKLLRHNECLWGTS